MISFTLALLAFTCSSALSLAIYLFLKLRKVERQSDALLKALGALVRYVDHDVRPILPALAALKKLDIDSLSDSIIREVRNRITMDLAN